MRVPEVTHPNVEARSADEDVRMCMCVLFTLSIRTCIALHAETHAHATCAHASTPARGMQACIEACARRACMHMNGNVRMRCAR